MNTDEQKAREAAVNYYLTLADALQLAGEIAHVAEPDLALALWESGIQAVECAKIAGRGLVIEDKRV